MPEQQPLPPAVPDPRPRVLVADDDPVMNVYAREHLVAAGFDTETVVDGPSAVAAVHELHPDLVILDVQMPGMDGFETCRQIRGSDEGRHTPILMLTGLDDLESIRKAYKAGATDFANKPANWTLLAHRLEYMLRSSHGARALRESRARLANAQRIAKLGYWEWNVSTDEVILSSQMRETLGLAEDAQLTGIESVLRQVHVEDRESVRRVLHELLEDGLSRDLDYRVQHSNGEERHVRQRTELTTDVGPEYSRVTGAVLDITDQQRAEDRARFLSCYDGMTKLPNRRSFANQLGTSLAAARRRDRHLAVVLIDLDRFNRINDTLGRGAGDRALQEIANRLGAHVRETARLGYHADEPLARLGGDEFALLLTDLSSSGEAAGVAQRIEEVISRPLLIGSTRLVLTASIGISVFPEDGGDGETLLSNAEAALYAARARGGDSFRYYSADMNENSAERLALETDLSAALARRELRLEYQPLYETASGRLIAAEALARWQHPERGLVGPGEFIPVAEQTGAIVAIGEWVMQAACVQAKDWQRAGLGEIGMSVNVSTRQLERADFPRTVERVLATSGLAANLLNLELTESFLLEDVERAVRSLQSLKALGVRLSLDDFGTGYSSLSYLMRLPLDTIKIDRSFLTGIPAQSLNRAITTAIIAMARGIDMDVVAEGVETEEQLEFLRQQGCDTLQGFLFSRPLPAADFADLVRQSVDPAARSNAA